ASGNLTSSGILSGTLTFEGNFNVILTEMKIDAEKTLAAGVAAAPDLGLLGMALLVKQVGTFAQSDVTGTWRFYSFSDHQSANAPTTARGALTFDSNGNLTGGTQILADGTNIVLTGGSLTINGSGIMSGTLSSNGLTQTLVELQMDTDKTIAVGVGSDSTGRQFLAIGVKEVGAFAQADLTGTWHLYDFFDSPTANAPGTIRGSLTFNAGGGITGGTLIDSSGASVPVTGGTVAANSQGILTGTITTAGPTSTVTELKMDFDKTVAAGVGTDNAGFRFLGMAIKQVAAVISKLFNISTRGPVGTGNDIMFGGFVIRPSDGPPKRVYMRAWGPTLVPFGLPGALSDPFLRVVNQDNGQEIATNDNYLTPPVCVPGIVCEPTAQI